MRDAVAKRLSAPHHVWAMQLACFFFLPWYTAHPQLPFTREHPPHPTPLCGFYSKHMLRMFEVPAIPGLSFFFPFWVFKVKPTKPNILWIPPNYNLWRCITAYPSMIKSYAIKILHMSFWREKDVLFLSSLFWSYRKPTHTLEIQS